ncbi:MAG: hypothetical protein ACHQ2Y_09060 [Candidatus Lutacidiplasmatales archaeon]
MSYDVWVWEMVALWSAVIVLGGLVSYYAFRSYRSTRSTSMFALAGGFFLVSAATGSMWIWVYATDFNYYTAEVACTGVTAVGFGVILFALARRGV